MTAREPRDTGTVPVSRPRFVGRQRDLATVRDALAQSPAVVLIEGEAGIGKSRLLREVLATTPGPALVGGCPPFRAPYTLGPVVDAVRPAADDVAALGLSSLAGALRQLFPEWAEALPPALEPAEDASAARHRLFRALVEVMQAVEATVLVVEDVHWADEATLEFLLFLVSQATMSLVVTYRPEEVAADSLLRRMSSGLPVGTARARVSLAALDVAQTAELVSSMLSDEKVSDSFAEFVRERTDGVPLAIEESVRLMSERADLLYRDGHWVRQDLADIAVPPTVRDAVLERTARFGPATLTVLRAMAVLVDPADEDLLVAVSGLAPDVVRAALAEALDAGLLDEDERGAVSYRHFLAYRAVYEAAAVRERRTMHLRAARHLERSTPQPVGRLARHFGEAGEFGEWFGYAERAADAAHLAGDESTGAALLDSLITHATTAAPNEVGRLTYKLTFASVTDEHRYNRLIAALRSTLDSDGLEPVPRAEVRAQLGRLLLHRSHYAEGYAQLERAVPELPRGSIQLAMTVALLSYPGWVDRTARTCRRWLQQVPQLTAGLPATERLRVDVDLMTSLLALGEQSGWEVAAELSTATGSAVDRPHVARVEVNIGDLALLWGRNVEARQRLDRALELTAAGQYQRLRSIARANLLRLDWRTGNWLNLAARAAALADDPELSPGSRREAALVAGALDAAGGDAERATRRLELVVDQTLPPRTVGIAVDPVAELAMLWLGQGRMADALRIGGEAVELIARSGLWILATAPVPVHVEALLAARRPDEAAALVADFAAGLGERQIPAPRAALLLCRAMLAEARGASGEAAARYEQAATAWAAQPRPYDALLATERRARVLLAAGDRAGVRLLDEARRGFARLGATVAKERAAATLREHGVAPHGGGRPSYGDELSPREREVVRLVSAGRTNPEIAAELVLSRQTVASHIRSAMRKVQVDSRTALAVRAVGLGLLDADE
ncbi:AAA family ATPase [Actinocatenispora sera]|uniref:ATP-binding protein n=1 Tax=Actinocatenispora sera TaxID=390989 RepID=UPI0033FF01EF